MERWLRLDVGCEGLGRRLLGCWTQPHRVYHSVDHLAAALDGLDVLGGGRLEGAAVWFHDAVWTLPADPRHDRDERRSADLARDWLGGVMPGRDVGEVARLVLLTAGHDPSPGDGSGARVSDADLVLLAADWERYKQTTAGLRDEAGLTGPAWTAVRRVQIEELMDGPRLYRAAPPSWEDAARANLARELELLA